MESSTKKLLAEELERATREFLRGAANVTSAEELAKRLHVSRSVVSKYLNEMAKKKLVVKIATRPVLFFDVPTLQKERGIVLSEFEFISLTEFERFLRVKGKQDEVFERVIGSHSSLHECVRNLKSSAKYPSPNGLCILLRGEEGTGKRFLVDQLALCLEEAGSEGGVTIVHCIQKPEGLGKLLFGAEGLLFGGKGGILLLAEADCIRQEVQNELAFLIENEYRFKRNGRSCKSRFRMVFTTTAGDNSCFSEHFLRAVQMEVCLPPLAERTLGEKEQLLAAFFEKEEEKLGREIHISNLVYHVLLKHGYEHNVKGMKEAVKAICAFANAEAAGERQMQIYARHLPPRLFPELKDTVYEEKQILSFRELKRAAGKDPVLEAYEGIRESFQRLRELSYAKEDFIRDAYKYMNKCSDYIIFEKKPENVRMETIRQIVRNVFAIVQDKYNIVAQAGYIEVLAALCYKKLYLDANLQKWEEEHRRETGEIWEFLRQEFPEECGISLYAAELLEKVLDIRECRMEVLFLTLNLYFYRPNRRRKKTMGLIAAHGYATASSIANAANRLLGGYVFDAIDMPLDVSVAEIARCMRDYMERCHGEDSVILLVDMGSLEEIGEEIGKESNIRVGIMNHVSTGAALEVGSRIQEFEELEEILRKASERTVCSYKVIAGRKRPDVILFASEAGTEVTERVIRLFEKSMPRKPDIRLLACDHRQLLAEGRDSPLFKEYNPLFIVGTMDSGLRGIPRLLLEDMAAVEDMEWMKRLLGKHFDEEELEKFNRNLLANFSLENVIENITILNPNILMNFIEKAVQNLQYQCKLHIAGKTKIFLYIHACCMVERLVTKTYGNGCEDTAEFEERQGDFIKAFCESFREVTEHYHIEIPISEIACMYEYIQAGAEEIP